jgi:hypothetical protein
LLSRKYTFVLKINRMIKLLCKLTHLDETFIFEPVTQTNIQWAKLMCKHLYYQHSIFRVIFDTHTIYYNYMRNLMVVDLKTERFCTKQDCVYRTKSLWNQYIPSAFLTLDLRIHVGVDMKYIFNDFACCHFL